MWLCAVKYTTVVTVFAVSAFVAVIISYGLGMRRANKAYWRMMHRAGSKITRDW